MNPGAGWSCAGLVLALVTHASTAGARQPEPETRWIDRFIDPQDHRFDMSSWLLERHGFLPVPLIITEPAVGYGGGMALAFFHPNRTRGVDGQASPPNITAVFGMATENGTWGAGAAHLGNWRRNSIRTVTALGRPSIQIDFYGGGDLPEIPGGIEYKLDGWVAYQSTIFRLRDSPWWAGGQFIYLDATSSLPNAPDDSAVDLSGEVQNLGLGAVVQFDSRNNIFSPTEGLEATLRLRNHWGDFRDSFSYPELDFDGQYYFGKGTHWYFGSRVQASFVGDEAPFYALPFISMRGIPAARYQGEQVISAEFEARYAIDGRWSVLGFAGAGLAASGDTGLFDASDRWAGGAGFRYLIARQLRFLSGVDVAHGAGKWAFYLQFGSAWSF